MFARGLREVDKFPALLKVHCRRHFYCHMLSMLKRILSYREVMIPVCGYVYEVYILTLAYRLVAFLA